jgi:hypothetical protein
MLFEFCKNYLCFMFSRFFAFILLVSHMNAAMWLPQVEEQDVFLNGQQVDDINSLIEYIEQEVLNIPDSSPEDEDDDKAQHFGLVKFENESCEVKFRFLQLGWPIFTTKQKCFVYTDGKPGLVHHDIIVPPPKA